MSEETPKKEDKDIFKEINELFTGVSEGHGFAKYQRQMLSLGHIPDNQFDHQHGLIHSPKRDTGDEEFNFLEDQNKYLGNIKDERVLRFYQNDNFFLTHIYSMGQTDDSMMLVFKVLWANFKSEIRMTCNLDGEERKLQSGLPVGLKEERRKGMGLLSRKKKHKAIDYVVPQEEEEVSNY